MISTKHEVFFEVARQLSFTKASHTLYISQSAISKQIKALEEYYKTGLFERLGNTISLTLAGKALFEKLEAVKQLQHELHQEIGQLARGFTPQFTLVLGASTTISLYILPPVLSGYLTRNPAVQVTLRNRNSQNILQALLAHEIDLGIIESIYKVTNVTYTPFLIDEVIAVCSSRNPLAGQQIDVNSLCQIPIALRETGSGTLAVLEKALEEKGVKLQNLPIRVRLGGTEALKNFVRVDTCLAFLPRQAVQSELASGELVEVKIKDLKVQRTFNFIQRKGTENAIPAKDFIQFVRRQYSKTE
ncbi:LysR substrate-binding domain-containing protein [Rufibacter sp. LB8]|uniref:LysR substrate-binding domain-containing protein n=1 Tax=Rufibacter sp. LB8 TaxID=2777781 RepID=UPI00178C6152|nr:LysR substrate-binding domain-containing protein [Rufibacter sp. LB8]